MVVKVVLVDVGRMMLSIKLFYSFTSRGLCGS